MMYAYSVSTKRSVVVAVVAVVALAVVMGGQRVHAQPGWVLSHQKISDTRWPARTSDLAGQAGVRIALPHR